MRAYFRALMIFRLIWPPVLVFIIIGVLWQLVAINIGSIFPRFEDMSRELIENIRFYGFHLKITVDNGIIGFGIGGALAVFLAISAVYFPVLGRAFVPVAVMLHATPTIAMAPALIVAFGFNAWPHIVIAAISSFFPMLINSIAGFKNIDKGALEIFEAMAASRTETFYRLRLPSSLPYLFAGAKLAITGAMIGSIVSEFTGTDKGLGAVIIMATAYLNLPRMWIAIFASLVATLGLIGLIDLLERRLIRW